MNRLTIIAVDNGKNEGIRSPSEKNRVSRREETRAIYEKLWKNDPEQFNPLRNCMERERLDRTEVLLKEHVDCRDKLAVDLGSGGGVFSDRLAAAGATVHAGDIAEHALKRIDDLNNPRIKTFQDYVPRTSLPDDRYDIVVCTELIAYLPSDDYRLLMSELSRLVKPDGFVVCSTPIDIYSYDALKKFGELAETEFRIEKWTFGYHALYLRLKSFFKAPESFIQGRRDKELRQSELKKRRSLNRQWYRLNTSFLPFFIWFPLQYLCRPVVGLLETNKRLLLFLETVCRFLSNINGISHAIFIGKRRSMLVSEPPDKIPQERPKKKEIWD